MAITVNIYYSGEGDAARKFTEEMISSGTVDAIRKEDGNLRYEYFFPMDDKNTVLLIDSWKDQESIDIHHQSEMMNVIFQLREKYDLHMKVERYYSDNQIPQQDENILKNEGDCMELRKVGIIGVGHVGAHVAYALLLQGIADELVLISKDEVKLTSQVQDLNDAVPYAKQKCYVHAGTFQDLGNCDVIVYTAGNVGLLVGNTDRAAELKFTIPLARSCAHQIKESGFKGILVNVTNPCDVVTREIAKILELPKGHVIGTGTCLDTSRLLSKLSQYTTVNHNSIEAFMIGQHGNYQFCPWSSVYFQGVPLSVLEKKYPQFQFDKEQLMKEVIEAGWLTFKGKQCTEYGIATTVTRMINAVFHDEKVILSATCELDGEYGETDIYAGVPCIIGKDGFEKVLELPLNEEEKKKFRECCEGIRENIKIAEEV